VLSKVGPSKPWRGEDKRRKRNDQFFWASSSINEVTDPQGNFLCYVDASRDNTERVRQVELLEARSVRDPLTGIFNRRYFNQRIDREWARALRKRRPIGLLIVDIDYFKRFNDRYGHLEGDSCLVRVAKALVDSVRRATDVVSRYGGEEFAVLLPDARQEGALSTGRRMLDGVRALGIEHGASDVAPMVTVSVGIAIGVPREGSDWKELLQSADDALYRAKMSGRNGLELAGRGPTEGEL
jgi:hemerythrin